MTINFKTSSHIASILTHAARTVRNGSTLKATREYMLYQLVTRVEAGQVEGADVGHCTGAFALQAVLRSKADFLAHCDREAAYWGDVAKEAIAAQRAAKAAKEAAPRVFDLCHDAADAVIAHRPAKNWIWQSWGNSLSDASEDLLGWMHDGESKTARLECTHGQTSFRWRRLDNGISGECGEWFPTVADAVRDYFAAGQSPAEILAQGNGWSIVGGPRDVGAVGVLMLNGRPVGSITWSTGYTPHLFRVQLADETHGFNERQAALDWAAARLAYLAGDDSAAVSPLTEAVETAGKTRVVFERQPENACVIRQNNGAFFHPRWRLNTTSMVIESIPDDVDPVLRMAAEIKNGVALIPVCKLGAALDVAIPAEMYVVHEDAFGGFQGAATR